MAKINPMALIDNMSGKVCMHSKEYFRTNKITGQVYSGKICNPYDGEPSVNQVAAQNRFKIVRAAILTRKAALTAEQLAALKKEFKAQTKIGDFNGYLFNKWNAEYDASGALIEG